MTTNTTSDVYRLAEHEYHEIKDKDERLALVERYRFRLKIATLLN